MKELTRDDERLIKAGLAIREALSELRKVDFCRWAQHCNHKLNTAEARRFELIWKLESCQTNVMDIMTQEARDAFINFCDRNH